MMPKSKTLLALIMALAMFAASCSDDDSAGPEVSVDVEDLTEDDPDDLIDAEEDDDSVCV